MVDDIEMSVRTGGIGTLPFKACGYAAAADFIASDPDHELFVFRKFNKLTARKLLFMQCEILWLERELDELDQVAAVSDDDLLCSAMRNYDVYRKHLKSHAGLQKRKKLQDNIGRKLNRYQKELLLQRDVALLEQPTPLALRTYREAIFGEGKLSPKITGSAAHFLDVSHRQYIVALNRAIDKDLLSRLLRTYWPFTGASNEHHPKARSFEERTLVFLVRFFSAAIAATLLIGSILALYFVTNQDARLALVIAFVVLFAIGLSVCTGAARDSIFAGTAAYAAVLIVFVSGNLSIRNSDR